MMKNSIYLLVFVKPLMLLKISTNREFTFMSLAHLTKTKIMAAKIRYVTFIENIKGFVYIIIHQKDFLSFN